MGADKPDLGRYEVTKEESDKGAFKTPVLRDLLRTAPYMHDGSVNTLSKIGHQPRMSDDTRAWLRKHYEPHNRRLEELLGHDLSAWNQ